MAKFTAHSIRFHWVNSKTNLAMTIPVDIGSLTSTDVSFNTETRGDDTGGIYDRFRAIVTQMPEFTFTTRTIQEPIFNIGLRGVCYESDGTRPGVELYGQLIDECNNDGSIDNCKLTFPTGFIRLVSLNVSRTDDASVTFAIDALYDGASPPVASDFTAVTLPTDPISTRYAMGSSVIGGFVIPEPTDFNMDFGLRLTEKLPALGEVWPETVGVRKIQPKLMIRGLNPVIFHENLIPLLGLPVENIDTLFQFKQRAEEAAFHPNGANKHFAYVCKGLATIDNAFSSNGDDPATIEANMECIYDDLYEGANTPVQFQFNQPYFPAS